MSDPDRRFLEDILSGRDLDERGLKKLFEIGRSNALNNIQAHEGLVSEHAKTPGSLPTFRTAYGVSITPELRKYAKEGMQGAGPVPVQSLSPEQQKAVQDYLRGLGGSPAP